MSFLLLEETALQSVGILSVEITHSAIPYLGAHADQITRGTPRATTQLQIVALG